jgi:hypothetical protein
MHAILVAVVIILVGLGFYICEQEERKHKEARSRTIGEILEG